MLSKNNFKERLRKMEPRKERFSIRKFSVGAASVLIGFFFMGMDQGQTVRAADTTQNDVNVEQSSSTQKEDANKYQPEYGENAGVGAWQRGDLGLRHRCLRRRGGRRGKRLLRQGHRCGGQAPGRRPDRQLQR